MNASEISTIIQYYSELNAQYPEKIQPIYNAVVESIKNESITSLSPIDCGISYLDNPVEYTEMVCAVVSKHLNRFKYEPITGISYDNSSTKFIHADLYNLIFPNLYSPYFEYKIKDLFRSKENEVLKPLQRATFEDNLMKQQGYSNLKLIKSYKKNSSAFVLNKLQGMFSLKPNKKDIKFPDYEKYRCSEKGYLSKLESDLLYISLQDLISKHRTYHGQLFNDLRKLYITEITDDKFQYAPVKGIERAFIKLKETINENPKIKFPLSTLKDLSRASIIFDNAQELIKFYTKFISNIEYSEKFQIYEVKNMFEKSNDYNYKDLKIILSYQATDDVQYLIEIQLILKDILTMKKTLHKFYDVSRADFTPHRQELYTSLIKFMDELKHKGFDVNWNETHPIYPLYKQILLTRELIKNKIDSGILIKEDVAKNTLIERKYLYENDGLLYQYISYSHLDDIEFYTEYNIPPYNSKDMINRFIIGYDYSETSFQAEISSSKDSKLITIYDVDDRKLSFNYYCYTFNMNDEYFNIGKMINLYSVDSGSPIGTYISGTNETFQEQKYILVYNPELKKFESIELNNDEDEDDLDEKYQSDYIPEYDLTVYWV